MKKLLKLSALTLGGVACVALLAFEGANLKAQSRLNRHFETHRFDAPLPTRGDTAAIARGKHLVEARYACQHCHGEHLGGGVMLNEPAIGRIFGPNLTTGSGGRAARYTMTDWDRIVRHGVKPDGTPSIMPSKDCFAMSDAELSDVVAFVRAAPSVDAELAKPSFGPIGTLLLALGKFPLAAEHQLDSTRPHPRTPPDTADNAEFGEHLAATCTNCHGSNLAGGPLTFGPPDWPAAANLTPDASGLRDWSYDDFERALTQGISKDGHPLREPMASVANGAKAMLPTERKAIWTYLRSLRPVATTTG